MTISNSSKEESRNRVIVGESDALARRAITAQFHDESGFSVIAATGDPQELVDLCAHYRPELTLVDSSADFGGLMACRHLIVNDSGARILVLERNPTAEREVAALWAGASGVVPREGEIVTAARRVLDGRMPHSDDAMRLLLTRLRSMPESGVGMRPVRSSLTSREWEVLDLLTRGYSLELIASDLYLSVDTVRSHVKNLFRKLGVNSRAAAVERGIQLRWPDPDERPDSKILPPAG